ncbi:MAG TPA: histidine phosphatase family protein [Gaiellales bacterium]|jgi:broad specificity phosphatase PhoE|nr:histidine phosphatase family protein [Gaiellales bacterium]
MTVARTGVGTSDGCRLYLVRHGRTVMNAEVRFRGRLEVPLDAVGRAEALAAARNLTTAGLAAVYTSPLARAREVAMAIAAASRLERVDDHDGLNNLDYGAWEGLTKEECAAHDPDAFRIYAEDPERAACPDGEALADAADRVVEALREIGTRHPGQSIAAVSHGAMVRLAVLRIAGPTIGDWQFKLPTGSATVIDYANGELTLASAVNRYQPDPRKAAAGTVDDTSAVAS